MCRGFVVALFGIGALVLSPAQSEGEWRDSDGAWDLGSDVEMAGEMDSWAVAADMETHEVAANDSGAPILDMSMTEDFTTKFARPVTNLNFNHPFIWNEFRPVFIHQDFPDDSALAGGDVQVYAAQIWLKLTDRLQLIADKDGYINFNPGGLPDQTGWADLAAGLKYNLVTDPAQEFVLSGGFTYEWTQGSGDVFQGQGDGIWDVFLSVAKGCGRTHFIGTAGFEIPQDSSEDSTAFHYHAHFDYDLCPQFIPLVELNGYHYLDNGARNGGLGAPLDFEGFDLTSFGSSNVEGNDVVTLGVGFRTPINRCTSFGAAYEWTLT
ncbi:MAG: hypothetical protein KC994_22095, partial [Candidatus Omnitrophica bacterium]|nr:hypothetical protein [Candidatus Omnitrophota bacterium]